MVEKKEKNYDQGQAVVCLHLHVKEKTRQRKRPKWLFYLFTKHNAPQRKWKMVGGIARRKRARNPERINFPCRLSVGRCSAIDSVADDGCRRRCRYSVARGVIVTQQIATENTWALEQDRMDESAWFQYQK